MKKSAVFHLLAALFLSVAASTGHSAESADSRGPLVVGYYPSWHSDLAPEKINYRLFTHLIHAFVNPDKNGGLHMEGNLPSRTLTKLAHESGVRVLLALGGEDSGVAMNALTKNEKATAAFIKNLSNIAREYGYDGIDVDWEYPDEGARDHMVQFVHALRAELSTWNPHALVTMAVPATEFGSKWFDGRLAGEVDFIQVMSYELHGPWKNEDGTRFSHSGYNAPLHETDSDPVDGHKQSFQKFVDLWVARGFPKEKILAGIPCFGRGFAVSSWGKEPVTASPHSEVSYKNVKALLAAGWVRHWDAQAMVPWLGSPKGDEIISYDDEQSALAKGAWAKQAGLRGIFFWEISQDYADGLNPLVEAARKGIGAGQ